MDRQSLVFRALADPNRRRLLDMLLASERSVRDMTDALDISQPAVSQHLQQLREAGLVTDRKEGRSRIYSVDPEPLTDAAEWLSKYEEFWDRSFEKLADLLKRKTN